MASIGKKTPAGKSKLKPSTLLGGHRGREPNKFQFDVTVDNVIGGSKAEYSVKWCRGVKTASTRHFQAEPKQKDGVAINQKLSLLCTLYRAKATEAFDFEPKDSKLSLISHKGGKKNEKTVGKTHFNLSNFAGVPSATTPHSFQLNAKTTINVTITCTFVRVSRGTASSCGSGLSGMTVSSGDLGGDRRGNDDFADMDDVPSPVAPDVLSPVSSAVDTPASSPAKPPPLPEGKGRPYTYEDEETPLHIFSHASPTAAAQSPKRSISGRVGSMKGTGRESSKNKAKLTALASEVEQLQHQLAESQRETEKSRVLHQMSEDIIRELREKIEFSHGSRTGPAGSRATELQKKVDELEKRLATSGVESKQMKGGYESRIVMLNTQVETMERAKARLDGENKAVREQLATLETTKASSVSGNESSRKEAEARQKLLAETSDLRKENERLAREADMNSQRVTRLELENKETSRDMERLHEKLDAHEQHALQVKDTYEELSKMYSDLRDDHTKVHSELMEARQRAKAAATAAAASSLSPRSTSFAEKSRRLMRSHKDKDKGEKGDTTEATTERESESWEIEIEEAKAELQKQKVLLVNAERATNDAEKQAANLECDLGAAVEKIESTRRDVDRLMERLETSKAKHMNANEQHEAAMQSVVEQKVEMKALKKQFQADLQQLRVEKLEESKKLRQAALQNAEIASKGNDDERIRNLEESLAEAAIREDQYEEEILKLTQIMDGLSNKLTETKALVDSAAAAEAAEAEVPGEVAAPSGSRSIPGASAASNAPAAALSRCQCSAATQCNANFEADDRKREDAPQITIKRTRTGLGFFMGSKKPVTSNDDDNFISSSKIRQMNLFEKITDGRLLNMLVETKMKLAIAEEEKLALEHLIRRVRKGDRLVQNKLAEHASRLEVKLSQANVMLANLGDDEGSEDTTRGKREAPRQMNPLNVPTVHTIGDLAGSDPKSHSVRNIHGTVYRSIEGTADLQRSASGRNSGQCSGAASARVSAVASGAPLAGAAVVGASVGSGCSGAASARVSAVASGAPLAGAAVVGASVARDAALDASRSGSGSIPGSARAESDGGGPVSGSQSGSVSESGSYSGADSDGGSSKESGSSNGKNS